ncbi:MAG: AraC family transcriptional regulator [Bacteroidales bacterium]|jgi:AraC-like DNA-binding protein|nr:AraC family transcriptional regulator [Bacteroidales bacterium]
MKEALHLQYLVAAPADLRWGLAVNSVGYQEVGAGEAYPPGNHPSRYLFSEEQGRVLEEYQLLYITRGQGIFRSASLSHSVRVGQGSMFLLFPAEWHSYRPDRETGWKEYWIGFKGSQMDQWVSDGFFSPAAPVSQIGLRSEVVNLYNDAIQTASQQESLFQQRLGGIVAHLMSLARFYGRNAAFSEVVDLINRAKILISDQYRTLSPEDLARQLCMGYSNFRRIFREYTGFSPAKYIQEVKLNRAKEALTNSSLPVKQVAYEMGYDNEDYFFTVFRRMTGMTPMQYRAFTQGKKTPAE